MPDLATHALATALVAHIHPNVRKLTALLLVGAMLPDLLTRPAYILFPDLFWFVFPLHTPLVLLFVCYACSFFFEEVHRQCVFTALFAGAFGHILLDFIQKSFTLSYAPLFPFSYARFSLNLLDPDDTLLLIPVLLVVIAGVWLARHIKNKGITNASH